MPEATDDERLLWALMRRFERLALDRYERNVPRLATPEKLRFVESIDRMGPDDTRLAASPFAAPVEALLARARSADEIETLVVQGLVLEHLGQAIYRIVERTERVGVESRALAADGLAASSTVTTGAAARLSATVGTGDPLYAVFVAASHDVLGLLDALADPVDRVFGENYGLRFADVMGEFSADLITACTSLGMPRRKVVAHLAGACMGL